MIDFICNLIVTRLNKEGIIQKEDNEVYLYGLQLLLSTLLKILGLMIIAYGLGVVRESIIFLLSFSVLRIHAGGVHAHTLFKCFISTAILMFSSIFISRLIPDNYNLNIQVILIVISIIMIYRYAPVADENKPLTDDEYVLYKKRSIITVLVVAIIIFVNNSLPWSYQYLSNISSIALFTESLTLLSIQPNNDIIK